MRHLRRLFQHAAFYLLLIHLAAMSLTWNLVAALLHPFLPPHAGTVVGRAAISSVYRGFWASAQWLGLMRVDCKALDVLSGDEGLIIAANHPSMLDAMLIVSRVPRGICIMRASLMRNPLLGPGARLARYILNDPPRAMIRSAVANLRAGGQLVLFPEGTRSPDPHTIHPLRPGITLIAHRAKVPIQTVLIETDSPYLGKDWPIWRVPRFPIAFSVRLGPRFHADSDHQGLLERIERCFACELGSR